MATDPLPPAKPAAENAEDRLTSPAARRLQTRLFIIAVVAWLAALAVAMLTERALPGHGFGIAMIVAATLLVYAVVVRAYQKRFPPVR